MHADSHVMSHVMMYKLYDIQHVRSKIYDLQTSYIQRWRDWVIIIEDFIKFYLPLSFRCLAFLNVFYLCSQSGRYHPILDVWDFRTTTELYYFVMTNIP